MTDQHDEQRARTRRQHERQYEIDRITFQYAEEYRQGQRPRIEDYIQRYPQYASDLLEYAIYFHTVGFEVPPFEEPAEVTLSPAAEKALAQIRERRAAYTPNAAPAASAVSAASVAPIEGLVKRGGELGLKPAQLAADVGLTAPLLARLEARKIAVASIPRALFQRLADTLKAAPEAIAAYLGAGQGGQAGAFYYADQPPTETQESFLDAIQASALSPEEKNRWAEIVSEDTAANP